MNIKILDKNENIIFKREEIKLLVEHSGTKTPDRKTIINDVIKSLKINKDLMLLRCVRTIFGQPNSIITLHVYKKRQDLEKNEPKHLIKRNTFEEEKKEEEKPVEEVSEKKEVVEEKKREKE